jgi:hypothetical protein
MELKQKWQKTDKHVFHTIFREHHKDMSVFASCTCPDGDLILGYRNPYIMTQWGFSNANVPIIKSVATKESIHQEEYDYEYSIAVWICEED